MKNSRRFSSLLARSLVLPFGGALVTVASAQTFGDSLLLENAPRARDIGFGDVDGDGTPDAVWTGWGGVNLRWQRGEGGGIFGPSRELSLDGIILNSDSLSIADLDADGDVDLMTTNFESGPLGAIRIYENLGAGLFGSPQTVTATPSSAMNGSVADMDGDGVGDLVFSSGNMQIYWCRNLGSMNFGPAALVVPANVAIDQVIPVDLEGDGDLDVLFRARTVNAIFQVENLGGGSFGPRLLATAQFTRPGELGAADFNGDGLMDLLCIADLTDQVRWSENLGTGAFGPPITIASGGTTPVSLATGDVDGDGDPDAIISWRTGDGIDWVENLGGGAFAAQADVGDKNRLGFQCDLVDVNGDGRPDAVVDSDDLDAPGAYWARNLGAGNFESLEPLAGSSPGLEGFDVADVDGDGDVDIVGVNPLEGSVEVVQNPGDGLFRGRREVATGLFSPYSARVADLDGDGDMDIVAGGGVADPLFFASVSWLENDGSGSFLPAVEILGRNADLGARIELIDFDADGDTDVLAEYTQFFSFTERVAVWIENDGTGGFTELAPRALGANARSLPLDIDGDSDIDLVALLPGATGTTLQSYENNAGVLGAGQPLPVLASFDAMLGATDLDGDGRTDLLILDGQDVLLLPGLPGPGFGAAATLLALPAPAARIATLDLDRDGDNDIVAYSNESAHWFESLGGGLMGGAQPITGWSDQYSNSSVGSADLDGDLDIDLYRDLGGAFAFHENGERFGRRYCLPGTPNSTGRPAIAAAEGSPSVTANDLSLGASHLPPGQFGFFVVGDAAGFAPSPGGSQGDLCVGGNIGRIARNQSEIFLSSPSGDASVGLDLTDVPSPGGVESLIAGQTRYFQAWFRDANPGATSNFTTGLRVTFRP